MAFSINTVISDGVTTQYPVSFVNGIYDRANVFVYVQDDVDGSGNQLERAFTWINDGLIQLNVVAPVGKRVTIQRKMNRNSPDVDYEDGAILDEKNLDQSYDHLLNLIHEVLDGEGVAPGESTTDEITHNDGVNDVNLETFLNNLQSGATTTDIITHDTGTQTVNLETYLRSLDTGGMYENVTDMFADYNAARVVYVAGGTVWHVTSVSNPMTIDNYRAEGPINIAAFGALQDGSDSGPAFQAALDKAEDDFSDVVIRGTYYVGQTIYLRNRSSINAYGARITGAQGIGEFFNASLAQNPGSVDYITIRGGEWYEDVPYDSGNSRYQEELANVTFYGGYGEYNSGSPQFVNRAQFEHVRATRWNRIMVSDFHRSWAIDKCFFRSRNFIEMRHKNVECSIKDSIIFGTNPNHATEVTQGLVIGEGINATTHPGMYPEGIKMIGCTIDQFGEALVVREVLDLNITDNWIGVDETDSQNKHCVKFEMNQSGQTVTGNNFIRGAHFNHNTYARGKIEFMPHSAPPTVCDIQMSDEIYVTARRIDIGNAWYNLTFDKWVIVPSSGTSVGINCINDNGRCKFTNLDFRQTGSLVSLIQVKGTTSLETRIDNVWCDSHIDDPFYIETPIRITNSHTAQAPITSASQGGQTVWTERLISTQTGGNPTDLAANSPTLRFKQGATVEVRVSGVVTGSATNTAFEVKSSTAGVIQTIHKAADSSWDSKFIEISDTKLRVDAVYHFKVISDEATFLQVEVVNGTVTCDTHSYVYARYVT